MLFVCYPKILHKHYLQFLFGVKLPQEKLKTMLMQNFWVTNKGHYDMLWYFDVEVGQLESHCLCADMSCADAWVVCEYRPHLIASLLLLGPFSREMSAFWL